MFVLMDIEWIKDQRYHVNPTQIAAMRVDDQWNCQEQFYARIHPRDDTFHDWKHLAYSGGTPSDFLYAHGIYRVLTDLLSWLREDDVICFWHTDARNILKSVYRFVLRIKILQRIVVLRDYLFPFLTERKMMTGNAYVLCNAYGFPADGPKHHSGNDVAAMQKALGYIQYPASLLLGEPPCDMQTAGKADDISQARPAPDESRPYQLEVDTGIFHQTGCSAIPDSAVLTGYPDLKYFFRKKLQACLHCMKEDVRQGVRARNQDIISRTQYQFIYAEHSNVFHRRGCFAILSTTDVIKGACYYDTVVRTGRRPCKLCDPAAGLGSNLAEKRAVKRIVRQTMKASARAVPGRTMSAQEQCAYARYTEARTERLTAAKGNFQSETEKKDFYTLTQTRFAFFCGAGYQTFHRRSCRKLDGLSNITGFSRYKDAIRSGHTPCKLCKPTAKLDIAYSIPITNQKRKGESINDLKALCTEHGYAYEIADSYFCFTTAVGKWKIDYSSNPYIVYHINRVRAPQNEFDYHRQPRLFLSLLDTFEYIQRHDQWLMDGTRGRTAQDLQTETGEKAL